MLAMLLHTNDIHNRTHFNPLNLVCINDIDSLTIPGIHEVLMQKYFNI